MFRKLFLAVIVVLGLSFVADAAHLGLSVPAERQGFRQPSELDQHVGGQNGSLFNTETTAATNTAVVVTLAAVANQRVRLYSLDARCSAGTASLIVASPSGTTIWSSLATEVGTARFAKSWSVALTADTNVAIVVTLGACGVGNTGTLTVQADKF